MTLKHQNETFETNLKQLYPKNPQKSPKNPKNPKNHFGIKLVKSCEAENLTRPHHHQPTVSNPTPAQIHC